MISEALNVEYSFLQNCGLEELLFLGKEARAKIKRINKANKKP